MGFIVTIVLATILIPLIGIVGAALTTSVSYTATVVYQYFIFKKQTGTKFSQWLLSSHDFIDFMKIIKVLFKSKNFD